MSHRSATKTANSRVRRAVGATSAVGAFLAFGMTPLTAAPASADGLDGLFDDLFSWVEPPAADTSGLEWLGFDGFGGDWAGMAAGTDPLQALNELVANHCRMLQRLVGETIELQTRNDPGGAPAEVDPNLMELLLMNLVVNARDALPQGGRIVIGLDTLCFRSWQQLARLTAHEIARYMGLSHNIELATDDMGMPYHDLIGDTPESGDETTNNLMFFSELGGTDISPGQRDILTRSGVLR